MMNCTFDYVGFGDRLHCYSLVFMIFIVIARDGAASRAIGGVGRKWVLGVKYSDQQRYIIRKLYV